MTEEERLAAAPEWAASLPEPARITPGQKG